MKKILILFALLAMLLTAMPASAQAPLEFDSVFVSVWPEFDNAEALVIYKMALSSKVALPATIILKVPSSVTRLWTVAVGESFETVSDSGVDYKFENGDAFSTVTLTANSRYIQIEYYDSIKKTDKKREYTYQWNGDGSVATFQFEVRQPLKAVNFKADPALGNTTTDDQGFQSSNVTEVNLQNGQRQIYKISYERDTNDPSTAFMQVEQNAQPAASNSLPSSLTDYLPWILGGLGVVFLGVALYLYTTSGRASRPAAEGRRRHNAGKADGMAAAAQSTHCPECGNKNVPGDRFCRTCGTKLR